MNLKKWLLILTVSPVIAIANPTTKPPYSVPDSQNTQAPLGHFSLHNITADDGVTRPFVIYHPKKDDRSTDSTTYPLLVYLHGAINRDAISTDPIASAQKSAIITLADKGGYYVLFPYGQKNATWFDDVGANMVMREIAWAKQQLPIDHNKVFLSGFSDGASGTLYLGGTQGEDFAGMIALNGSLAVAAHLGKTPVYPANYNQKPLYIVNTDADMLYPTRAMSPVVAWLEQYHQAIHYRQPTGSHDTRYLPQLLDELTTFIDDHRDEPAWQISLEVVDLTHKHYDWLSIEALDLEKDAKTWHKPYQLTMHNDKASFGIGLDANHQGDGVKVASFSNNSTAKRLGVRLGDIITHMEDTPLDNPYATFSYLSKKKAGDDTQLTLIRDGKTLTLTGRFNEGYDYQVFEKQPASAKIIAQLQQNASGAYDLHINSSRVAQFAIDFDKLPKNVTVTRLFINNKEHPVTASGQQVFNAP